MPVLGIKTKHVYEYEGGYPLKNGKNLTKEIAREIGIAMGLPPASGNISYDSDAKMVPCDADYPNGDKYRKDTNPYYTPYIHIDSPLPPMLVFLCSCPFDKKPMSSYTINLNTLKPTKNSPIQKLLPDYIIYQLK